MDTHPRTRVYAFHDLRLGCSSNDEVAAALHARLERFPNSSDGPCDLAFGYYTTGNSARHLVEPPLERTRPIYDSAMGEVLYSDTRDQMYITCGDRVRVACDPEGGQTSVSMADSAAEQLWLVTHPLFTLPLIESLKRRGRYSLHAAGVEINGKAVLFPGTSGSGKSTLALALLRAGCGFLGDDMLFLAYGKDGLGVLAFPEAIDLTDRTVRLFPELHDLLDLPRLPGWPKRQVRADERYGAGIVWECLPVALVFPHVANTDRSVLTPMDRGEALLELAPNVLLTEAGSSQAHLDALADLVAVCDCYRLETGRDFAELATRLRSLVEAHE